MTLKAPRQKSQRSPAARKKKIMSEVPVLSPEVEKEVVKETSKKGQVSLSIIRPPDGQNLELHICAPVVARIIRSMAISNFPMEKFDPIYKPILAPHPQDKTGKQAMTRAAIAKATKNFEGGTDFDFNKTPRSILLANPDLLETGYILTYKVETPIPPDLLRKWGKQFVDGCSDIVSAARPFRMQWVMEEVPEKKVK